MARELEVEEMAKILGGSRSLGMRALGYSDLIRAIRRGLPYRCIEALSSLLKWPRSRLCAILQIPERTVARRKAEARLRASESDSLVRLAHLVAKAIRVLGSAEKAAHWMETPNRALGQVAPLSLLDTEVGVRQVEGVLGRIEFGVYS